MATRPDSPTSPAARAFRRNLDKLMPLIQPADIIPLGLRLFAKEIISHDVNQMLANNGLRVPYRVHQMLMAVLSQLSRRPDLFETVLKVLKEEQVFQDVAEAIEQTKRALEQAPPVRPGEWWVTCMEEMQSCQVTAF